MSPWGWMWADGASKYCWKHPWNLSLHHLIHLEISCFLVKILPNDFSVASYHALLKTKIGRHPAMIIAGPTRDPGCLSQYTDIFHDQLKIFRFHTQCLLMFSFHDVKDAEVIYVTLTDDLTSWDAPFISWNTWVRAGWCVVRKYTDAPVHLHHVSTTCSAEI